MLLATGLALSEGRIEEEIGHSKAKIRHSGEANRTPEAAHCKAGNGQEHDSCKEVCHHEGQFVFQVGKTLQCGLVLERADYNSSGVTAVMVLWCRSRCSYVFVRAYNNTIEKPQPPPQSNFN